jgi:hypothetical protein
MLPSTANIAVCGDSAGGVHVVVGAGVGSGAGCGGTVCTALTKEIKPASSIAVRAVPVVGTCSAPPPSSPASHRAGSSCVSNRACLAAVLCPSTVTASATCRNSYRNVDAPNRTAASAKDAIILRRHNCSARGLVCACVCVCVCVCVGGGGGVNNRIVLDSMNCWWFKVCLEGVTRHPLSNSERRCASLLASHASKK